MKEGSPIYTTANFEGNKNTIIRQTLIIFSDHDSSEFSGVMRLGKSNISRYIEYINQSKISLCTPRLMAQK